MSTLGLDISSTCVGIALINEEESILYTEAFKLSSGASLEERAWLFQDKMTEIKKKFDVDKIYVEQPIMAGGPNAKTVAILNCFNGMCRFVIFDTFNKCPILVHSGSARAKLGIKISRGKNKTATEKKKPIIEFVKEKYKNTQTPLVYETTPKGNPSPGTSDICDAITIALAGPRLIQNG